MGEDVRAALRPTRGPWPGHGRGPGIPWAGLVEETPALWVTWFVDFARRLGYPPPRGLHLLGVYVAIVGVRLTFGTRHFFQCPACGRRCEAIYLLGERVACRKCLRLGYRSQATRAGSPWGWVDRFLGRNALIPPRWSPHGAVGQALAQILGDHIKGRLETVLAALGGFDGGYPEDR